jgi:hypothetical protein
VINVVAVDPDHVGDTRVKKCRRPRPDPAAHVQDTGRPEHLDQQRDYHRHRGARILKAVIEERFIVNR